MTTRDELFTTYAQRIERAIEVLKYKTAGDWDAWWPFMDDLQEVADYFKNVTNPKDESDLTDDKVTQMYDEATPVEVERGWLCAERWRGPIPDGSDSLAFHLCLEPQGHQGQHLCTCGANP